MVRSVLPLVTSNSALAKAGGATHATSDAAAARAATALRAAAATGCPFFVDPSRRRRRDGSMSSTFDESRRVRAATAWLASALFSCFRTSSTPNTTRVRLCIFLRLRGTNVQITPDSHVHRVDHDATPPNVSGREQRHKPRGQMTVSIYYTISLGSMNEKSGFRAAALWHSASLCRRGTVAVLRV